MQAGRRLRAGLTAAGVISAAMLATAVPAAAGSPAQPPHQPSGQVDATHPASSQAPGRQVSNTRQAAAEARSGGQSHTEFSSNTSSIGPALSAALAVSSSAATSQAQTSATATQLTGPEADHAPAVQITRGHFGASAGQATSGNALTTKSILLTASSGAAGGGTGGSAAGSPAGSQPVALSPTERPLLRSPGGSVGTAAPAPPPVNPLPNTSAPPGSVPAIPAQLTGAQLDWLLVLLVGVLAFGLSAAIRVARRGRGGRS